MNPIKLNEQAGQAAAPSLFSKAAKAQGKVALFDRLFGQAMPIDGQSGPVATALIAGAAQMQSADTNAEGGAQNGDGDAKPEILSLIAQQMQSGKSDGETEKPAKPAKIAEALATASQSVVEASETPAEGTAAALAEETGEPTLSLDLAVTEGGELTPEMETSSEALELGAETVLIETEEWSAVDVPTVETDVGTPEVVEEVAQQIVAASTTDAEAKEVASDAPLTDEMPAETSDATPVKGVEPEIARVEAPVIGEAPAQPIAAAVAAPVAQAQPQTMAKAAEQVVNRAANNSTTDKTPARAAPDAAAQPQGDEPINGSSSKEPMTFEKASITPRDILRPTVAAAAKQTAETMKDLGAPITDPQTALQNGAAAMPQTASPAVDQTASVTDPSFAPEPEPETTIDTTQEVWVDTLAQEIEVRFDEMGGEIELALTPENLGNVRIRMEMRDGAAQVVIVTENPESAKLFAQNESKLSEMLSRSGITLTSQDASSDRQGDRGGQNGRGSGGQAGQLAGADGTSDTSSSRASRQSSSIVNLIA